MEKAQSLFADLKKGYAAGEEPSKLRQLLSQVKIQLTQFNFLIPDSSNPPAFLLSREVLEYGVLISVREKDVTGFDRQVAQLKAYYQDPKAKNIAESENKNLILGLNLIRLLGQNKIKEFHRELELIPSSQQDNKFIKYAMNIEHYLAEGSYKVINTVQVPDPSYSYFMEILWNTVRSEISGGFEKGYHALKVSEAQSLLKFNSDQDTRQFLQSRNIEVSGEDIKFGSRVPKAINAKTAIPAMDLIHQTLHYAKELERIV